MPIGGNNSPFRTSNMDNPFPLNSPIYSNILRDILWNLGLTKKIISLFDENYNFTGRKHENRTDMDWTPRIYTSFYEMAEEAAISRFYRGLHLQKAIYLGLEQGYQIGVNVIDD